MTESRKEYLLNYKKEKLKRIPLELTKEKYQEVKAAAEHSGKKVNTYIKLAIDEKMEREKE